MILPCPRDDGLNSAGVSIEDYASFLLLIVETNRCAVFSSVCHVVNLISGTAAMLL